MLRNKHRCRSLKGQQMAAGSSASRMSVSRAMIFAALGRSCRRCAQQSVIKSHSACGARQKESRGPYRVSIKGTEGPMWSLTIRLVSATHLRAQRGVQAGPHALEGHPGGQVVELVLVEVPFASELLRKRRDAVHHFVEQRAVAVDVYPLVLLLEENEKRTEPQTGLGGHPKQCSGPL